MLAVQIKKIKRDNKKMVEKSKPEDLIIYKKENEIIEYNKDGSYTVKTGYKKVNITKYINETKKIINVNTAEERLKELAKAVLDKE